MANTIRDRARLFLEQLPPLGKEVVSYGNEGPDGKTNKLFNTLTNSTHSFLQNEWKEGKITTTCNAFVGAYGAFLGAQKSLGQFEIEKLLASWHKAYAWVPATSGKRPKYGDIFRPKKFHMGVSLDFQGDQWNTAESGQGGKNTGYDITKRKQQPWDPSLLQGWVDIELFFGPGVVNAGPIPDWLPGWWNVNWQGRTYYYFFDRNGQVKWTKMKPRSIAYPPLAAEATGNYVVEFRKDVTLQWFAPKGSIEKFSREPGFGNKPMRGTLNGKDQLIAARM
ncbi:MAG TPA: hypothetical protein VJ890_08400 [Vineibacter sp.]|nr:hypothetical protein [Vineibacter sp.]